MKCKEIYGRKWTRDNRSVLSLCNKHPLLVPVLAVLVQYLTVFVPVQLKIVRNVLDIFVRY